MGIQMMGGNPLESFQTGYNLGNKPNAIGTAILTAMDRYKQKQLMDQELGNKLKLSQWESQNITGPAETAKFEREKGWEREKMGLEGKNKIKELIFKNTLENKSSMNTDYSNDLSGAVDAIGKGADKIAVFQRIASKYPKKSSELKRIIMADDKMTMEDILANIQALQK